MTTFYKTIIDLDTFVEKKVGEEVNSMKELPNGYFKFSTDNFIVELSVKEDLYNGYEILAVDVEEK